MRKWEQLEEWIIAEELAGGDGSGWFTCAAVAEGFEVPGWQASRMIEAYLDAQRSPRVDTQLVIRRMPGTRTANTRWLVGATSRGAEAMGEQWASDAQRRFEREITPTLAAIGKANPRALRKAEAVVGAIEASLELIGAMLDGDG